MLSDTGKCVSSGTERSGLPGLVPLPLNPSPTVSNGPFHPVSPDSLL